MNIRYFLIILIIIFLVYNLYISEHFPIIFLKESNSINLYNKTIVRIRAQNQSFDWFEPYIKTSTYESIGTGFFINDKGHIITNYHVINDAIKTYIQIPITGNKTYNCEIISMFPKQDLALLKILDYKENKFLNLGDSNKLSRGNKVIALGYPLGQNKLKITSGIISGFQDGDIQTDSAINPGNSGGPLIYKNKVIGINYAGYDDAQNVGYAIPVNYFVNNYNDMLKTKIINYPILGCTFNNTNDTIIKDFSNCSEGYYISNVFKDGPMDKIGVKVGDILCYFDNLKIDNFGELTLKELNIKININHYLKYKKIGEKINIKINRNKKILNKVLILSSNKFYKIRTKYPLYEKIDYVIIAGMVIMELSNNHLKDNTNTIIQKYNLIENKLDNKLIITKILKGSNLAEFEIFKEPNILVKVNDINVSCINTLKKALSKTISKNNQEYISFLTEDHKYFILEKDEIKKEELFLSNKIGYELKTDMKYILGI